MLKKNNLCLFFILLVIIGSAFIFNLNQKETQLKSADEDIATNIAEEKLRNEVLYGRELILHTPLYLGPKGSVAKITGNLMSCNNCHLAGGSRPWGLPLVDSHGLYPQFRAREGKVLSLADRINTCISVPMLGRPLDKESREMQAMLLYIRYLGANRKILASDDDQRLVKIDFIDRPASYEKGEKVYREHCVRCHGENGQGKLSADENFYIYPPLWGQQSYRVGSSLYRLSIAARFIKANMPFETSGTGKFVLSDADAFDVAAFINDEVKHPRPVAPNYPLYANLEYKPFDYPHGPYFDSFSEEQHRLGPFKEIKEFYDKNRVQMGLSDGDVNGP